MRRPSALLLAALCLLALPLASCGGDQPTRLYVLSPTVDKPASTSPQGLAVGVGPITLPKYLDRPQIVTRVNGNSLTQANLDQWGGDLNDNITRVLATDLSNLLATDRVSLYPWKDGAPVDYQVTLDITRFEQDANGASVLNAFWSIVNPKDGTVLTMRRTNYTEAGSPVTPPSTTSNLLADTSSTSSNRPYDALAAAMSRDLGSLSKDIATAIQQLRGGS